LQVIFDNNRKGESMRTAFTLGTSSFALASPALHEICTVLDQIAEDDEAAAKGTKAALRRIRVRLSLISKLCKQARIDVLEKMNADKSIMPSRPA
jgi:hypothetical protein